MKNRYGIIYLIRNKLNNKIYIGQTTRTFDERYGNDVYKFTHNKHLKNSIKKDRIENFEIDKEFDIAYSKDELDKLEKLYINAYNTTNSKYGYNKMFGGSSGKHTKETKAKLSKIQTEMFGRKVICVTTMEVFDSISKASNKYKISGGNIVLCCQKEISKAGYLDNIPLQWLYYEDYLNGERSIDRRIICITTNKIYFSMEEAIKDEKYKKLNISGISQCCSLEYASSGELLDSTRLQWLYYSDYLDGIKPKELIETKVICVTTNKVFYSAKEAGECYNIDYSHLYDNCKGKYLYCGELNDRTKLQWLYYKDYVNGQLSTKIEDSRVMCLTTGKMFNTIKEASDFYNCDKSVLAKCCKGTRKSCGKDEKGNPLIWIYYRNYLETA